MRNKGLLMIAASLLFLSACSAHEGDDTSSVNITSNATVQSDQTTSAPTETTDVSADENTSTSKSTTSAPAAEATATSKEIPQTPPDIPLSCAELGDGQIVLISWFANVNLHNFDEKSFDVSGRYITSDGALYEFKIDDIDYIENDIFRTWGGIYQLEEEYLPEIDQYSSFLGYTEPDLLNGIYDEVKGADTGELEITEYHSFEESDELTYYVDDMSASDKIFTENKFVYCYALCDTDNIETLDERCDIISERDGIRKMLLYGVSFEKTVQCARPFDYNRVLYPDKR